MKNLLIAAGAVCIFMVCGCKKNETRYELAHKMRTEDAENLAVDSIIVKDSVKITDSLFYTYKSGILYFPGLRNKKLLDSIYFKHNILTGISKESLRFMLEKEKEEYYRQLNKDTEGWVNDDIEDRQWYFNSGMKLESVHNGFMHIRYSEVSYEGGAHDNYTYYDKVFDLKNNKKVELNDITSIKGEELSELLKRRITGTHGGAGNGRGEVVSPDMLLIKTIPVTENFYFDNRHLYFHYNPYEIAVFAAGDIIIPVSWEELKGTLKPEFKKRMKIE
jgi:hypothetical protein